MLAHDHIHVRSRSQYIFTPLQAQASPQVAHVLQLERWLMEGAYNKVLAAMRAPMASDLHALLVSQLSATVR